MFTSSTAANVIAKFRRRIPRRWKTGSVARLRDSSTRLKVASEGQRRYDITPSPGILFLRVAWGSQGVPASTQLFGETCENHGADSGQFAIIVESCTECTGFI
jgi:hypothetical protein